MDDVENILDAYRRRSSDSRLKDHYGFRNKGDTYAMRRRESALIDLLTARNLWPLSDKRILDVGCGMGWLLRRLIDMGADPSNCCGIDVNAERLDRAAAINSRVTFLNRSADDTGLSGSSFDVITQFMAFSSMPSSAMRRAAVTEMLRLLAPGGTIIWYDFRVRHPRNRDVAPMPAREVRALFSDCSVALKPVTLAPPITRRLAPYSEIACLVLEKIPILRTHYLGSITPRSDAPARESA